MEFAYDGGGMGKGGTVTLYCDGKEVGKGRVDQTQGFVFSADETTDIGYESGTTVSPDYTAHTSRFNGKIHWVQIDLGKDAAGRRPLHLAGRASPRRDGAAVDTPAVDMLSIWCRALCTGSTVNLHWPAPFRAAGASIGLAAMPAFQNR